MFEQPYSGEERPIGGARMRTRRPTIVDVAKRANVSKSLVSLVLQDSPKVSDSRRSAVLSAIEELGYRPNSAARTLVRRSSDAFGVHIYDLHNPVFAEIIDGIEKVARRSGATVLLVSGGGSPDEERRVVGTLLTGRADGLIMLGHRLPRKDIAKIASVIPIVIVTRADLRVPGVDTVRNDDYFGAGLGVQHLVDLGHRRITYISGGATYVARERCRGYVDAMAQCGLKNAVSLVPGGFTEAAGYEAAIKALTLEPRPTALFAPNDLAALGVCAAVDERGLSIGSDVSVVGYDGMFLASIRRISLTTIAQPLVQLGEIAGELLKARIESGGMAPARHVVLNPEVVVRASTGKPALRP